MRKHQNIRGEGHHKSRWQDDKDGFGWGWGHQKCDPDGPDTLILTEQTDQFEFVLVPGTIDTVANYGRHATLSGPDADQFELDRHGNLSFTGEVSAANYLEHFADAEPDIFVDGQPVDVLGIWGI